jgi:hypothetical protein
MEQMEWHYKDNMTQEMLDVLPTKEELEAEHALCLAKFLAAKAAPVKLPATAVSGKPVLHGANQTIYAIEEYWHDRLRLVERLR